MLLSKPLSHFIIYFWISLGLPLAYECECSRVLLSAELEGKQIGPFRTHVPVWLDITVTRSGNPELHRLGSRLRHNWLLKRVSVTNGSLVLRLLAVGCLTVWHLKAAGKQCINAFHSQDDLCFCFIQSDREVKGFTCCRRGKPVQRELVSIFIMSAVYLFSSPSALTKRCQFKSKIQLIKLLENKMCPDINMRQ